MTEIANYANTPWHVSLRWRLIKWLARGDAVFLNGAVLWSEGSPQGAVGVSHPGQGFLADGMVLYGDVQPMMGVTILPRGAQPPPPAAPMWDDA